MKPAWSHRWDLSPAEARALQDSARPRVSLADDADDYRLPPRVVAVDVGYDRATDRCHAALVEWDVAAGAATLELTHTAPSTYPYVPGLLTFREIPPLLPLFARLDVPPRLVLCDGQGIAHPRRIGLASHLGLVLDCPTIGWAKSRLIGTYAEPHGRRGAATPLMDAEEQIGWVLRSRAGCRVTFVSPGHRVSLEGALARARALIGPCRLSEPARRAHQLTRLAMQAEAPPPTLKLPATRAHRGDPA